MVGAVRSEGREGKPAAEPLRQSRIGSHFASVAVNRPFHGHTPRKFPAPSGKRRSGNLALLRTSCPTIVPHFSFHCNSFSHFSPYFCVIYNLFTFKIHPIGISERPASRKTASRLRPFFPHFSATLHSLWRLLSLRQRAQTGEQKHFSTLLYRIIQRNIRVPASFAPSGLPAAASFRQTFSKILSNCIDTRSKNML